MTRYYYHLMGTLDSLLRYLDNVAPVTPSPPPAPPPFPAPGSCAVSCSGTYPHPFASNSSAGNPNHIQAFNNVECIRRSLQSKAKALSVSLDDMLDARNSLFVIAQSAYTGFGFSDLEDAMSGTRVRRRTFPQMSFTDVGFALAEKDYNNPAPLSTLTQVTKFLNCLRTRAKPAVDFVNALAAAAQNNKLLLDEFKLRRCDLFQALSALNIAAAGQTKSPLEELDPTLQNTVKKLIEILRDVKPAALVAGNKCAAGGGGPGDGKWPGPVTNSSSSSSSSS